MSSRWDTKGQGIESLGSIAPVSRVGENFLRDFKAAPRATRAADSDAQPGSRFASAWLASDAGRLARRAKSGAAETEEVTEPRRI